MTPARALERAVVLPNDANLANDRRRRHRSTSARARETRDGRSGTRARAIADGESKREDANGADGVEDAIEASRGVTSTVSATVRRTRAIAGMLEGKDEKVAEAELKALTSRAANETSSLLEDLAPYARPSEDAAWEEYERAREDAMRRGVAFSAVMGMGVAAVTSTVGADALLASVESIPPLAAFEQLLGIAVTLYYGTVYRRLLTTSEGRRGLRLSFAEAFSQISGAAELVGRSAATNAALDGAVCKTMEDIRAMPSNEVPPSVIRAMDVYVRSRDEEKRRLKSAAVEREREAVRLQREREAKAEAMERERANQKREREQTMERRKREMEAKAAAVKRERDAKAREREAKAEAVRKEREAKAEAAQREREMKAMGAEEARVAREAQAKATQEAKEAQAKATQEAKEAQAKAAQDERDAQAAKVAQDERDAQAAKAAQEARDAQAAKAAQDERKAQAAKAAQDEREAQAAKESQAPPVTSVVTTTDETVTESVNEEIENLRAKLAAQTEKFELVSKDLEKLMEDDSAAKGALKEARAEIETLRAQLAEAESAPRADPEEIENLRKQLADMEARMNEEVEQLRVALKSSQNETERARADLNMWEQRAKEASARVNELTARVSKLIDPSRLKTVTDERNALQRQLNEAKSEARTEAANARALDSKMQKAGAELSVEKSKTESLKKDLDGLQKSAVAMKESLKKANSDMERYRLEKESALEALQNAEAQAEQKSREMREELSRALAEKDKTIAEVETEKDAALSEMAELQEVINDLTLKRNEVAQKDAKIELLQSRVVSARAERDKIRDESRARQQELRSAQNAANELKRTYDSEMASLKSKMVDGSALRAVEAAAEKDAQRQQQEIERLIDAEATARRALDEVESLTRSTTEEYENEKKRLEAELAAKQNEIEQARREAEAEISEMRLKYEALTVQKSTVEESFEEMKRAMEVESARSEKLLEDAKRLASQTSYRMQEEIDRLREESLSSESKLAAQTEKFEQVSKDLEKLMEDDSAAKSALKEARAEIETLRAQLADMEARMNEEVERSRLAADEMERRLADADKRASELHDELRRERESAAKTLEEITRERDELTAKLRAAQTAASSASSEASNDKMNAQLAQLERELQLAKDDIDLERQQIREEAAAEIQSLTERAAQELAEAESRFAAQLEEVEARLAAAEIAARDAESNAESISKAAAAAQTEARSSTSPTPVTVADASATERPAIVLDPTALVALSKMKRDELVAEAEARGLDSTGVAAELRNRLRDARAIEKRAFTQKRRAQSRKKPTGYYRVIATVKYDNELLSAADDIMAEFGEINRVGVEKLFAKLFDGAGVTEVELRTMDMLLVGGSGRYEYILTDPAVAHLQPRLDAVRAIQARNVGFTRSTSQYTVEDGVKYDDGLLSFARSIATTAQSVDVIRAEIVFNTALDGGRVTDAEIATLERVLSSRDEFPLDADARAWFERALERVKSER